MRNITIRHKLLILITLLTIVLVYFGTRELQTKTALNREVATLRVLIELQSLAGLVIHELQRERGMSSGYLGARGVLFTEQLALQHARTDRQRAQLAHWFMEVYPGAIPSEIDEHLEQIREKIIGLEDIRAKVLALETNVDTVVQYYSQLIEILIQASYSFNGFSSDARLALLGRAYSVFLSTKELAGLERALGSNALAEGRFLPGRKTHFTTLIEQQKYGFALFLSMVPEDARRLYLETEQSPAALAVDALRAQLLNPSVHGMGFSPLRWFDIITDKIDHLQRVELELSVKMDERVCKLQEETQAALKQLWTLLAAALFAYLLLTLTIFRSIVRPLSLLVDYARDISAGRLDRKLNLQGQDEIGQLGEAMQQLVADLQTNIQKAESRGQEAHRLSEARLEAARQLETALALAEDARDNLSAILASVNDGIVVTDRENRILLMNRAAEEVLGVEYEKVRNQPIHYAIQDGTLRDSFKNCLVKAQRLASYTFDFSCAQSEHSTCEQVFQARTSVNHDTQGNQTGIVTIIQDVTRERALDQIKNDFISTAAHELRTPLTSIQGFSEILLARKHLSEAERKEFLIYINDQAVLLGRLISDLMDISRIESGLSFSLNKKEQDLRQLLRQKLKAFRAGLSRHELSAAIPDEPCITSVDGDKFLQVLENILSNASKYSPDGGTIHVAMQCSETEVAITVTDQGLGMTPEQVSRIFEKFYRADTSDSGIPGTGLGMGIAKHIMDAHDGEIHIQSEIGQGTTVRLTLPRPKQRKKGS